MHPSFHSLCTIKSVTSLQFSLYKTCVDIKAYFVALQKKNLTISKFKIKQKIAFFTVELRAKAIQLETAVTFEILTTKGATVIVGPSPPDCYTAGINYYYGLEGKPKNHVTAFKKFGGIRYYVLLLLAIY